MIRDEWLKKKNRNHIPIFCKWPAFVLFPETLLCWNTAGKCWTTKNSRWEWRNMLATKTYTTTSWLWKTMRSVGIRCVIAQRKSQNPSTPCCVASDHWRDAEGQLLALHEPQLRTQLWNAEGKLETRWPLLLADFSTSWWLTSVCVSLQWTVNGQLRVGFFTTKAVSAGTELTFDYQFQRYGYWLSSRSP